MKIKTDQVSKWKEQYEQLRQELSAIGYVSQGSVAQREPPGGPRYQWTRKEQGKTVGVALSEAQYHWMKDAIANQRRLTKIVKQMQKISRQILFQTVAGTTHRNPLSNKVLGIN